MTHRQDMTSLVRALYAPFHTGDTELYDLILDPRWVDLPLAPGQRPGPAGLRAQIALFRTAVPDDDVVNEDILIDGNTAASRTTVIGTHLGPFLGLQTVAVTALAMAAAVS